VRLTDFLQNVGRPIAYYPELRKITGSVTATILLCQFIYWRGKESDPNGWLYKTSDDIQQETGLSYGEQKTARRDLVEAGLIEEHYARLDHQMKFRVILEAVNDKWGNDETVIPESGKPHFGNDEKPLSLNESEITAEIKAEITTGKAVEKSKPAKRTDELKPDYRVGMDWKILADQPITEEDLQTERVQREAPRMFEKAFGFGTLPWDSTAEWERLRSFITRIYRKRPEAFGEYVVWRGGEGKYTAMSNKQIRMTPAVFIDTGWPEFEKTQKPTEPERPEYKPFQFEDESQYVPRPKQ